MSDYGYSNVYIRHAFSTLHTHRPTVALQCSLRLQLV